jgi:hypothetical protein
MNLLWLIYALAVLVISGVIGLHLGKFREAYTEMTGMMAGMTMGMLNGFLLGYAIAAATSSMFWGNLFGILFGAAVGVYYGRAGGLMGMLDGGMGGAMGGSMGAMLLVMLFPPVTTLWTAGFLVILYIVGMGGLVVLIERSDLGHAALHNTLPWLRRAIEAEVGEIHDRGRISASQAGGVRLDDYYTLLGVQRDANPQTINGGYLNKLASAGSNEAAHLEQAFLTLSDPQKRAVYDRTLLAVNGASDGPGDCCPPPRKKKSAVAESTAALPAVASAAPRTAVGATATAPIQTRVASQGARPQGKQPQPPAKGYTDRQHKPSQNNGKHSARRAPKKEAPVSWVGVLAVMVAAVFMMAWWIAGANSGANNSAGLPWEPQMGHVTGPPNVDKAALEPQAVAAVVGSNGVQSLDFKVVGDYMEYKPKVIKLKQNVPAHLNISIEGRDPGCGRFVGFKGLGQHAVVEPGQTTALDFTPTQAGVYEINCSMNMMVPGYLIVE